VLGLGFDSVAVFCNLVAFRILLITYRPELPAYCVHVLRYMFMLFICSILKLQ